ncbi:hypothetical protein ACE6H2_027477 [Prunus campanulata]
MAPPSQDSLMGPPSLRRPNPFPDIFDLTLKTTYEPGPSMGRGQSGQSSSHPTSNPCITFFFKASRYTADHTRKKTPPEYWYFGGIQRDLIDYEEEAWKFDPLTTFKLIFALRMVERLDTDGFYRALLWVHKNHPLTLSLNVMALGGKGWFKDLLGFLYFVLEDPIKEAEAKAKLKKNGIVNYDYGYYDSDEDDFYQSYPYKEEIGVEEKEKNREEITGTDTRIGRAKMAVERYQSDLDYRNLHDRISEMFAHFLTSDLGFLESGEIEKISFAYKFCPSVNSGYDRATLLCENIAKRIFPRHDYEEYSELEEAHYAYRVRDRLRKQVLVPLRKVLESSSSSRKIRYVPTVPWLLSQNPKALAGLRRYRRILSNEREYESKLYLMENGGKNGSKSQFKLYINVVEFFRVSIGDGLELPHQIVFPFLYMNKEHNERSELEWQTLVQDFSNKGKLRNCLAVCDIQESMRETCEDMVCIGMGLLISELSENPWNGMVFPFSLSPKLCKIEGENLQSKCNFMREIECSVKLDFLAVYNQILDTATSQNLSPDKMPKRIFVFTNRDFQKAFKRDWQDNYKEALKNYRRRGYQTLPDVVFWNLKGGMREPELINCPLKENHKVGLILTGFSDNMLTMFLNGESDSRPYAAHQIQAPYGIDVRKCIPRAEDVMKCAISGPEFDTLLVFD